MEGVHVSGWKSAILIISAGARKRSFADFPGAPPTRAASDSKRVRQKGK